MKRMDQHTHSLVSPDGSTPFREMAGAAVAAGLGEICLTDHFDLLDHTGMVYTSFDWTAVRREVTAARARWGGQIRVSLGLELGEAPEDFAAAARVLAEEPELDFVIGSVHNLGSAWGGTDCYDTDYRGKPELCARHLTRYFAVLRTLCRDGSFDSLGHILYPLRYMTERDGNRVPLSPYYDRMEEIFRLLIASGRALELNTTRGRTLFGQREVFRLYRDCGGTLVTVGSDAHRPVSVGIGIPEAYALLRELGFHSVTRFERRRPVQVPLSGT